MSNGKGHSISPAGAPVFVTGLGFVTPLGRTVDAFDDALFNARSAVRARTLCIEGLDPMELAVAACEFDAADVRSNSRLPLDRGTAMALAAAHDAAAEAGLDAGSVDPTRLGIFWGSGLAGAGTFDDTTQALYAEQRRMRRWQSSHCSSARKAPPLHTPAPALLRRWPSVKRCAPSAAAGSTWPLQADTTRCSRRA